MTIRPLAPDFRPQTYWKVALLGWQDSLVYRFNALIWVLYATLPSLTLMLVWKAAYEGDPKARIGGLSLGEMMTYYLLVTALSVAITPHPEWDIASAIRDGKLTPFLLRPVSYFGYRLAWESAYQIVKTAMMLPGFALIWWFFRADILLPPFDFARFGLFLLASLGAYLILSQLKFLLGISAFWLLEPGGLMELWNILSGLFAGRLLPLQLLPGWAQTVGHRAAVFDFVFVSDSNFDEPRQHGRIALGLRAARRLAGDFDFCRSMGMAARSARLRSRRVVTLELIS